jgi:RNA polymerase sigma-70 factor (ECF subfamily)
MCNTPGSAGHNFCMERNERFEVLYHAHAPAVMSYIKRRATPAAVDEAFADVFVVCWRRSEEVPSDALPWLLGVARRVLSSQRRGEGRRAALQARLSELAREGHEEIPPALAGGPVADALEGLSAGDRELLMLIAWEGLSQKQAAVVLGQRPGTVRVRVLRARRRLAHALASRRRLPATTATPLRMESE